LHSPKARIAADFESRVALANFRSPAPVSNGRRGFFTREEVMLATLDSAKAVYSGAVRAVKMELRLPSKEHWQRFREMSDTCREMANCAWETWLVEHVNRGTGRKIREWLANDKAWREAGSQGKRPKFEGFAVDAAMSKLIYRACVTECPQLTPAAVSAFLQAFTKKIGERKASNGNLPGWWAILLHRESLPSSTKSQPVPLRAAELIVLPPTKEVPTWRVQFKSHRQGFGIVTTDRLEMIAGTRKTASSTAKLQRIASGEYKLCGSNLVYDRWNNKWFVSLGYQHKEAAGMREGEGTAFLHAAYQSPWRLRIGGRSFKRRGDGREVGEVRRQLLTQRWSRQANYRYAGSANKGHGRNRALLPVEKLSNRWKDFVKTSNRQMAAAVVAECVQRNVKTLVYFQPSGKVSANRFLAKVGKVDGRQDATGWDWFQVKTCLASECEEQGIHFVCRKTGEGPSGTSDKVGGKPKTNKPPRKKAKVSAA
jgi:hypothetical protein